MKLKDVVEKVTKHNGSVDVCIEAGNVNSFYLFKGEYECELNNSNNLLSISTEDDDAYLMIKNADQLSVADESDIEFDKIVLENSGVKIRLIFV